METYNILVYMQLLTIYCKFSLKQQAYFQAILYILDAAKLIQVRGNIDDFLFLVALSPFYCQTWERQTVNRLSMQMFLGKCVISLL